MTVGPRNQPVVRFPTARFPVTNSESQRITLRAADVERRAEELERWKKEFLANVSHELRTPLNAILGYSHLLLNEQLPGRYHRQIEEIHGAGNILLDLINNIIDFSKLSGGEIRLSKLPFHVRDVAAELIEHYRPGTEHKGLRLECHIPADVPTFLRGDKLRYRQVLACLLSNAVKFTHHGGIDVRLTVDEITSDQITLRTIVTDTGIGIATDRTEAVFREFSQGDGSTTRSFGGLGLGLAVAKRLVDLMGGQIGFRSDLGGGTSFWVALPFGTFVPTDNLPDELPSDQYLAGPGNANAIGPARPRILAVDSDATQRILLEAFLSRTGCLVDAVSSIDDAVAAARGLAYDLAFVEIPTLSDGWIHRIHRVRDVIHSRGRHTPIIASGTGLKPDDRQKIVEAGANGVLAKPFDVPDLIATVQHYLPLAVEPLREAEANWEQASQTCQSGGASAWLDRIDDVKRAFASADYVSLESRAGALRRQAITKGAQPIADEAMRLQLAARNGDGHRMVAALGRLEQLICAARRTETACRSQCRTC